MDAPARKRVRFSITHHYIEAQKQIPVQTEDGRCHRARHKQDTRSDVQQQCDPMDDVAQWGEVTADSIRRAENKAANRAKTRTGRDSSTQLFSQNRHVQTAVRVQEATIRMGQLEIHHR